MALDDLVMTLGGPRIPLQVLRGDATGSLRTDDPQGVMMRGLAYGTLAKLCQRAPCVAFG